MILVIEDEIQIRENVREVLELAGFKVVTAENGAIGLRLARTTNPALILCDITMPELDGYGVLKALRQDPEIADISIIFLTAKADRQELRQGMELGADDYLTKPFEPDELIRTVITRLERHNTLTQKCKVDYEQIRQLKQEVNQRQQELKRSQQLATIKTDILNKLSQDLRNPLSNINMAICMLKTATSDETRDRYLTILQEECTRELALLNEVDELQKLLTPENAQLLQRFQILDR